MERHSQQNNVIEPQALDCDHGQVYGRLEAQGTLKLFTNLHQDGAGLKPKESCFNCASQNHSFSISYYDKHERNGALEDLVAAIQLGQKALDLTPQDDSCKAGRLQSLGNSLRARYEQTGASEDLSAAIQLCQEALNLTPQDDPNKAGRLQSLGNSLRARYERYGTLEDLTVAIQMAQEALSLTSICSPDRAGRLESLRTGHYERYGRIGEVEDLEVCIQFYQEAVDLTPQDDFARSGRLKSLGTSLQTRYQRTQSLNDLEEATRCFQNALNLTPHDHPDQADGLNRLGSIYHDRYIRFEESADLTKAILLYQESLDITPYDHPDRACQLCDLGEGLKARYERNRVSGDIIVAIQRFQEALNLTPDNHPDRAGRLESLAAACFVRYVQAEASDDIVDAIHWYQEAVNLTPSDHPERVSRIESLAIAYHEKYLQTDVLDDIVEAIHWYQEAVNLTPSDHPERATRIEKLANGISSRFHRDGIPDDILVGDIVEAIQLFQKALDLTPPDHPDRANRLEDLANVCCAKRIGAAIPNDIGNSVVLFKEALDLTPHDHSERARRLERLGSSLVLKYYQSQSPDDLEEAIMQLRQAIDSTPKDDCNRAYRLHSLGNSLEVRWDLNGNQKDLEEAIKAYWEGTTHVPSTAKSRAMVGRVLLARYADAQNWRLAHETASIVLSLIPSIIPYSLKFSNKQHMVGNFVFLASDAAAILLKAGKPVYEAIRLLEIGRGILSSTLGKIRIDVPDLERKYPDLANRFKHFRIPMDTPTERRELERHNTDQGFNKVVQEIRAKPGFDQFFLGLTLSEDELRAAAIHGPIAVINISTYSNHALIVEQERVWSLELPLLRNADIQDWAKTLPNPNLELLEWLWRTTASPILEAIGLTKTPEHQWPRIWWIPTGSLAEFPIHAAGRFASVDTYDTVLDRVCSSYSSSIGVLISNRQQDRHSKTFDEQECITLVGMAETPGYSSLPFVSEEIEVLTEISKSMQLQVKQPFSCREQVLSAINSCKIFHFAGHGYSDQVDPLRSALILNDGKLSVKDLFETNLHQNHFLAYLSACGTGQVKHIGFIDEGLHLILACQLAGFRNVIGTLWQVNDKSSVYVARLVYEWIKKHPKSESVSQGLHHACRELRNRWVRENNTRGALRRTTLVQEHPPSIPTEARDPRDATSVDDLPLYWVPYAHFGI